jgi:ATP-dependent RNA helicase DHX29
LRILFSRVKSVYLPLLTFSVLSSPFRRPRRNQGIMPPNSKKKKKPASNPARGFATVSMPSKPKPEATPTPSPATGESKATPESEPQAQRTEERTAGAGAPQPTPSLQDYTPEELEKHLEEAELQILVDKYATRCKNDAARQATKLDNERRVFRQQSVTLSLLEWLPTEIQDRILELSGAEEHEYFATNARPSSKQVGSEEELYSKLWTLKETLLKLEFPENRVEDALKHVLQYFAGNSTSAGRDVVWNLDEALEWLATHSDKLELPSYTQTNGRQQKDTNTVTSWMAGKPLNDLEFIYP